MNKSMSIRVYTILLLMFFIHCSKDFSNKPQDKDAPDQIVVIAELVASASHVMVGGAQIVVQAKLTDQYQQSVFGEPVHFSTTLGSITEVDTTDSEGLAHAVLTSSNQPGAAVVTANYQNEHTRTVTVYFDSTATGSSFSYHLSKNRVLANGADSIVVNITMINDEGRPDINKPVTFTASTGRFKSAIVFTNVEGVAQNCFQTYASRYDSSATLTFRANGVDHNTAVSIIGVDFSMSANPQFLIADGRSRAEITGVIKETTRLVAIPNESVVFATNLGTIPWQGTSSDDGVVKVDLTSSTDFGTAQVVGYYGNGITDTVYVDFIQSVPANMYITVNPPILPADNVSTSEIQVRVTDTTNDPIQDGLPVHFTITQGSGSLEPVKTTMNGIVKNLLTAGNRPDTTIVSIRAGQLQDSVQVIYKVGEVAFVEISADSASIPADGITTTAVYARVTDNAGNPVRDGTTVRFTATIGNVTSESITSDGIAVAQFSSNETGVSTITASVGSVSSETTINLRAGSPASVLLNYDPTSIGVRDSGRNQTLRIIADVRDSKNNTVSDGTWVRFSIYASPQGGETLSSFEPIPTVNGKAEVSLISGTRSGTVRIQAEVVDDNNVPLIPTVRAISTEIIIFAGPPFIEDVNDRRTSHLTVGTDPLNILGWYFVNSTATVTAVVGDRYNNPVPVGTAVYFTTTGGVISTHMGYTDEEGLATVTIHSAQPYPTIERFYQTFYDPNRSHPDFNLPTNVIPGPIPDFEFSQVLNSQGGFDENDGIVRIMASSEGVDANGNKANVWAVTGLVFSGLINTFTVSVDTTVLSPGQSAYIQIQIYDVNGNPIVPGSSLLAEASAGALSWATLETSDPGVTLYHLYLTNNLDPSNPDAKETSTKVTIKVSSENGNVVQSTATILLKLE